MDIEILILGTDINAYYMARCYHELYHKKAHILGKEAMHFTDLSNITNITYEPNLWDTECFKKALETFAKGHSNNPILLVASNDFYVRLIAENKDFLTPFYYFNYPDLDIVNNLLEKDKFYHAYHDKLNLPKTIFYDCSKNDPVPEEFTYPLILKPGNGISYYKHYFEGQSKVYKIKNKEELFNIVDKIKVSGYMDQLIIQEFIPGDDSALFDCMIYCNTKKQAQIATFAQIGLQEWTNTGVGNCTVLVNGYNEHGIDEAFILELKTFLEDIGYQGWAEFDLKYDNRDGTYKLFEINPRQARSSYYLTALGHNVVGYLIDDIFKQEEKPFFILKDKMVLRFVSDSVINTHIKNKQLKQEIKQLMKAGKVCDPLDYKKDTHMKRKLYLWLRKWNYKKKYKENEW